eukprot:m.84667 g.84667  ORF g.84667 m.84667 type:complete len:335 (+) comp25780_c0_seq1:150-1154(+)
MRAAPGENLRYLILLVMWYGSSTFQNVWGKNVLVKFPHPMVLTLCQMAVTCAILPMLMSLWNQRKRKYSKKQYIQGLIPLAILKLLATFSSHFTLLHVPVSYAHTVKALMPVCSVILTRLILGQKTSWKICMCLVPIVIGVIITSATEIELNVLGLISAVSSTLLLSSQVIFTKKAMGTIDHLNLILITSRLCLGIFLPIWLYAEGWTMLFGDTVAKLDLSNAEMANVMVQLLASSVCSYTQQVAAFTFLSLVPPVTYSVANVSKRIFVIMFSVVYYGQTTTPMNIMGMGVAIAGVFCYNVVKRKEAAEENLSLPTTSKMSPRRSNYLKSQIII